VVHFVVDGGLVENQVAIGVSAVVDSVVGGGVELLDGLMEVVAPLLRNVELDGNGAFDLRRIFTYELVVYMFCVSLGELALLSSADC
jgi:hypothetical protein